MLGIISGLKRSTEGGIGKIYFNEKTNDYDGNSSIMLLPGFL